MTLDLKKLLLSRKQNHECVRHLALFGNVFVYGIMQRRFCSFRILTASIDNRNAWNLPLFLKNETTKKRYEKSYLLWVCFSFEQTF
jgi:hypothetical protein